MIHRAILESGGCEKSESLEEGYERARILAKRAGCEFDDLDCLRAAPAKKFLGGLAILYKEGMPYAPHHDGHLLTGTPLSMIREGNYNRVPFMAGYNRNEVDVALIFRPALWHALPFQYEWRIRRNMKLTRAESHRLVELYPLDEFNSKPRKAYGQIYTHSVLGCPTYLGLASAAEHQQDAFLYRFDYDEMKYGKYTGALHAMEVPFVFNSIEGTGLYDESNLDGARELARVIQGYWTNFARTGDPNGPDLPPWPRFDPEEQLLQVLDTTVHTEPAGVSEGCAFWDEYSKTHPGMEETLGSRQKK